MNEMKIDFKEHNLEVKEVWDSFNKGIPIRIPMMIGVNVRFLLLDQNLNIENISFKDYSENPDIMFDYQVKFDYYRRMNIPADHEMGIPEAGWTVSVDFQNYKEAAWFGAEIKYADNEVPDTIPFLTDDNKKMLFDKGIPDAFEGIMGRGRDYYEYFQEKSKNYSYRGVKVGNIGKAFNSTDGLFTTACNLRGTTELCIDMFEDPQYVHDLLNYITEATIYRIKAWRKYYGISELSDSFGFADDSIALLSVDQYREFVLPYHKKLCDSLAVPNTKIGIHLCGDATHLFKVIRDELNVYSFDTGFPVRHGELVKELGPDVRINGGPRADLLRSGSEDEIERETKRIIDEVKQHTKKFVLRDANNLAPKTPINNIYAMYQACKKYGQY